MRVNLILVPVVVRDSNGKIVTNLKKEDFQVRDNRKPQIISTFSVETPASHLVPLKMDTGSGAAPSEGTPVKTAELPARFISLYFDDVHLSTEDAVLSRQAATKLLDAIQTGDRLGIFTTSGQVQQDFTADRGQLAGILQRILPRALSNGVLDCPPMTFFEAYQFIEVNDPLAKQVAIADATACTGEPRAAPMLAEAAARRALTVGETETQYSFRNLDSLIARMKTLPGQRIIVLMSPGFFLTPSTRESGDVIDLAAKSNIVINAIDARGLYVSSAFDSASRFPLDPPHMQFITEEEMVQEGVLAELADGTGGTFFHNRNDIDEGLLQAVREPEVSYLLGFSPQNLRLDGKYHNLTVSLTRKQKWNLQARRGYFAPRADVDPEVAAREEVQQAVFSQEELQDLPLECQTQFFKSARGSHLGVVAHITTRGLKFLRNEDRSTDKLIVATAIFDQNGNLVTGQERIIEMQLTDATLEKMNRFGLTVNSTFDLLPGTFLLRIVVRDSAGAQMAALNRAVVIPF
jgi:VWFA-related protein